MLKKSGEAVKLPVEVKAGKNIKAASTVTINLPEGAGKTKVKIPVKNMTAGTVAVLVNADGTEKIVKKSVAAKRWSSADRGRRHYSEARR